MKNTLFCCLFACSTLLSIGQTQVDLSKYDQDTVLSYIWSGYANNYSSSDVELLNKEYPYHYWVNYQLSFHPNSSIYDLTVWHEDSQYLLSWGEYEIRKGRLYLQDRVAGFTLKASIDSSGPRFDKEYFTDLNHVVWENWQSEPDGENEAVGKMYIIFDQAKAKLYRADFSRQQKELLPFTPGIYHHNTLRIHEDGKWICKFPAPIEGHWRRKGNILILHCPILSCNFYMTIEGEGLLRSMLVLGDIRGYYFRLDEDQ